MKTQIIAICGGSGSGKTFFANTLYERLGELKSSIILQDHYYKDQSDKFDYDGGSVNFDHPDALDFDLLLEHLKLLKAGKEINIPQYDFSTHKRLESSTHQKVKKIIILDGILLLSQQKLRPLFDLSIFIDTPEKIRFERRLKRDIIERARSEQGVKAQFEKQVKPMHDKFVEPSKEFADLVNSGTDMVAFENLLEELLTKFSSY